MSGRVLRAVSALLIAIGSVAVTTSAAPAATCRLPVFDPGADYQPRIDPATFTPTVDNPYFPLTVGTTLDAPRGSQAGRRRR